MLNKTLIALSAVFIAIGALCCESNEPSANNEISDTATTVVKDSSINIIKDTTTVINPDTINPIMKDNRTLLFVGTYNNGCKTSTGVYVYQMDTVTGVLTYMSAAPTSTNPSYLVVHPNKKWLFTTNESSNGMVTAYNIDTVNKKLILINSSSSKGNAPCYVSVDGSGKLLMVANYNNGIVAMLPIDTNGNLQSATSFIQHVGTGPNTSRQTSPHAHCIIPGPIGNLAYSCDLGADKVFIYKIDAQNQKLVSAGIDAATTAGSGPRHITFHNNNKWAYLITEISGTIEAFNIDATTGALSNFQKISTMANGSTNAPSSADIHISPDGRFLYGSNRGSNNNIAIFAINQSSGALTLVGHQSTLGKTPRNFSIDPSGKFLLVANVDSCEIVVFSIDKLTGLLTDTGIKISIANPVCLKFL